MRVPSLRKLNDAVRCARDEQLRPPSVEEGVRAVLPLSCIVQQRHGRVLWQTVAQLRRDAPEVYDAYLGEQFLADAIVDIVAASDEPGDWVTLTTALERRARDEGEWLVAMPLANLLLPERYLAVTDGVGLGMTPGDRDWKIAHEAPFRPGGIFKHLQDRISRDVRWRREDQRLGPLDTRRTAVLYLIQPGTQTVAVSVATSRARYALALWCLLRPPEPGELHPTLADWEPRPYLDHAVADKLYEPGAIPAIEKARPGEGAAVPDELPERLAVTDQPDTATGAAPLRRGAGRRSSSSTAPSNHACR